MLYRLSPVAVILFKICFNESFFSFCLFINETKSTINQITAMFDSIDSENTFRSNDYVGQMWEELKNLPLIPGSAVDKRRCSLGSQNEIDEQIEKSQKTILDIP